MASELERIAAGLLDSLDEVPEIVGHLRRTAIRLRQQASWIADLSSGSPHGRMAALHLDAAARACDEAAYRLAMAPQRARAWATEKVSGGRGAGGG